MLNAFVPIILFCFLPVWTRRRAVFHFFFLVLCVYSDRSWSICCSKANAVASMARKRSSQFILHRIILVLVVYVTASNEQRSFYVLSTFEFFNHLIYGSYDITPHPPPPSLMLLRTNWRTIDRYYCIRRIKFYFCSSIHLLYCKLLGYVRTFNHVAVFWPGCH